MARRSAAQRTTPKAEQAQSNTVLIVFVVISMLANVGLGIMWYLSQDEIANANKTKSAATAAASSAQAEKRTAEAAMIRIRQMIDDTVSEAERQAMLAEASRLQNLYGEAWASALFRRVEGDANSQDAAAKAGLLGPYDNTSGKLPNTFAARMKSLDDKIGQLDRQLKTAKEDLAKRTADFDQYKKDFNEALLAQKVNDNAKRNDADTKEKLNQKQLVIDSQAQKISGLEKQVAAMLEEQKNAAAAEIKKLSDRFETTLNAKEKELQETKQLLLSKNVIQLDKPRGQIVRAEQAGDMVYINLGSAQGLTPGTTFSVHGRGPGGAPQQDPKLRIEVVTVLGSNVAMARIKQVAKPEGSRAGLTSSDAGYWVSDSREFWRARNPALPGDMLFNPAWEPNREVHVALAGSFDIDGDGQDDLQAFIKLLKNHGVEVDAYLDPAEGFKQRGRLTNQTEFLVIGGVAAGKGEAVGGLQGEAAKKGIEVVTMKRFLDRMGFSPERLPLAKSGKLAEPADSAGDKPAGDKPAGDKPPGDKPPGDKPAGDKPAGNGEKKEGN